MTIRDIKGTNLKEEMEKIKKTKLISYKNLFLLTCM